MEVTAKLSNLRISPRKVRLVADLIRGSSVKEARGRLSFLVKKTSSPLLKLLDSAAANAKHNFKLNPDEMYISNISVDGGPVLKRTMPRAMGRSYLIRKRTSHINLTLSEKKDKHINTKKPIDIKKMPNEEKSDKKVAVIKKVKKTAVGVTDKEKNKKSLAPKKRLTGLAKRAFVTKSP